MTERTPSPSTTPLPHGGGAGGEGLSARVAVRRGTFALGPLELGVPAGRALLCFGPSLSGKTSLLKALVGLVPAEGHCAAGGARAELAGRAGLEALRAKVGMVFQNDALFDSLSALENAALPLLRRGVARAEAEARAAEALARVGLAGAEAKLPEQLSGGMRKRLGIARALAPACPVLLVDEPLAGLDPASCDRIAGLLEGAKAEGRAVLVAVADPGPLWRLADEALALEAGRVFARGPAAEVREAARPLLEVA